MQQRPESDIKFLDPTLLARIGSLELIAKFVVEGFISGLHKSPYHGFSIEFAQYRQYIPGDDTKHIDWKVYGRTNRHYIKQFEEETNLYCYLLLDTSASMTYTSMELTKLDYASYLAASLAYFMIRQRDAVGFAYFDGALRQFMPARSSPVHLHTILQMLHQIEVQKQTQLAEPLHQIAQRLTKRGLVILLSDLYAEETESVINALEHFRYNGHEVIVFHLLDRQELTFDFNQTARFVDAETDHEITADPNAIRQTYLQHHNDFIQTYQQAAAKSNIDYNTIDTATPLDFALSAYLAKRQGLV
ncbi:DUF58 domain-containing protein [Candidatus Poribacteria bacterium]|nr:DUF58 domain-containing protein [Candidatus Poribacteria bacterium]